MYYPVQNFEYLLSLKLHLILGKFLLLFLEAISCRADKDMIYNTTLSYLRNLHFPLVWHLCGTHF